MSVYTEFMRNTLMVCLQTDYKKKKKIPLHNIFEMCTENGITHTKYSQNHNAQMSKGETKYGMFGRGNEIKQLTVLSCLAKRYFIFHLRKKSVDYYDLSIILLIYRKLEKER